MGTHCGSLRRSTRSEELACRDRPRSNGTTFRSGLGDTVRWLSRADAHDVRLVNVVLLDRLVFAERNLSELVLLLLVLDTEDVESSVSSRRTEKCGTHAAPILTSTDPLVR